MPDSNRPLSQQHDMDLLEGAPKELKDFWNKHRQPPSHGEDLADLDMFDVLEPNPRLAADLIENAFGAFSGPLENAYFVENKSFLAPKAYCPDTALEMLDKKTSRVAFRSKEIPGLIIIPNLLPFSVQIELLGRLLHRDLFDSSNQTNLHNDFHWPSRNNQTSHFENSPESLLTPINIEQNRPLKVSEALNKGLSWMTLGEQYDWSKKLYPEEESPKFPIDIASFVHHLFPEIEPQAAIVKIYSAGGSGRADLRRGQMGLHRDASESVDKGLASISIGCSSIFIIGFQDEATQEIRKLALRLRSGDVLFMSGKSRLAWHGVARTEKGTCPVPLRAWPGSDFPEWENWLEDKRVNLNVRQVRKTELQENDYIHLPVKDPVDSSLPDTYLPPADKSHQNINLQDAPRASGSPTLP